MTEPAQVEWPKLIDEILLNKIIKYAAACPEDIETVYLTGSYVRGTYNARRPNVNVYLIAAPHRAPAVRVELGRVFADIRRELRIEAVDFMIDCHPYTISQRDPDWLDRPLLTLTTKVLAGEAAANRYHISPTIGLGWFAAHKILVGRPDALDVFARPPVRDRAWLHGAHQALSHYRNILDHLPWALDWVPRPHRLVEESSRYAEEALRDGVHIGLTDEELEAGRNIEILHDWASVGRDFYRDRYGDDGVWACDAVARLKAAVLADGGACEADAEHAWHDALRVWSVVWDGYHRLAMRMGADDELLRVTAWL
jgi:predicted nucleotidyltransferase